MHQRYPLMINAHILPPQVHIYIKLEIKNYQQVMGGSKWSKKYSQMSNFLLHLDHRNSNPMWPWTSASQAIKNTEKYCYYFFGWYFLREWLKGRLISSIFEYRNKFKFHWIFFVSIGEQASWFCPSFSEEWFEIFY